MKIGISIVGVLATLVASSAVSAAIVATDNYESGGASYGSGGGTGFGPHVDLNGTGGIFGQTNDRRIDGTQSLGVFSSGSSEELGRTVTDTSAFGSVNGTQVLYTASMRFDIPNSQTGFKGVNLKSALGSSFAANEIIAVGLTSGTGNNSLQVRGSTNQTLDLGGELRGAIIDVTIAYNLASGAYTVTADNRDNAAAPVSITGTVANPGSLIPGAVGFIHSDEGGFGTNAYFDSLSLQAIPEPTTLGLLGGIAITALRRRR